MPLLAKLMVLSAVFIIVRGAGHGEHCENDIECLCTPAECLCDNSNDCPGKCAATFGARNWGNKPGEWCRNNGDCKQYEGHFVDCVKSGCDGTCVMIYAGDL